MKGYKFSDLYSNDKSIRELVFRDHLTTLPIRAKVLINILAHVSSNLKLRENEKKEVKKRLVEKGNKDAAQLVDEYKFIQRSIEMDESLEGLKSIYRFDDPDSIKEWLEIAIAIVQDAIDNAREVGKTFPEGTMVEVKRAALRRLREIIGGLSYNHAKIFKGGYVYNEDNDSYFSGFELLKRKILMCKNFFVAPPGDSDQVVEAFEKFGPMDRTKILLLELGLYKKDVEKVLGSGKVIDDLINVLEKAIKER